MSVSISTVGYIKEWQNSWRSCWNHINPSSSKVDKMTPFPAALSPFFVEPLLPTQPEEIADLSRSVSTPIALGERLYTRADFRPYLERRAIDIAQPDVCNVPEFLVVAEQRAIYPTGISLRWNQRIAPHCLSNGDVRCRPRPPLSAWANCTCGVYAGRYHGTKLCVLPHLSCIV
jgi:hypothetical protein